MKSVSVCLSLRTLSLWTIVLFSASCVTVIPEIWCCPLRQPTKKSANKLFSNMSSRVAQNIRDDLEITSNVRMRDVEEAQQRIVGIIRSLEEKGEIIILKGGKDDIIA